LSETGKDADLTVGNFLGPPFGSNWPPSSAKRWFEEVTDSGRRGDYLPTQRERLLTAVSRNTTNSKP